MQIVLCAGLQDKDATTYEGNEEGLAGLLLDTLEHGEMIGSTGKSTTDMMSLLVATRARRTLVSGTCASNNRGSVWGVRLEEASQAHSFAVIWRDSCWQVWLLDQVARAAFKRFANGHGFVQIPTTP